MAYSPKYGSLSDVPLSGPDEYTAADKERALKSAEAMLEGDVNEGTPIADVEDIHAFAADALATHIISGGAKSPQSTKLGDLADSGSIRADYANTYRDLYDRAVATILNAQGDEGAEDHIIYTV